MALYDKASLVLIPSGTKESLVFSQKPTNGDGDFTFSRSTSATRVGPSGYIEKERTNYVRYSQDFSQWTILGGATITTGVTDPNGGSTAATISNIGAGSLSDGIAIFSNPMTIGAGSVVSQSIYLKGSGTIAIAMERGVSGTYFFYQKTITLTSTWQRFDNFEQIGSAADGFHFYVANYTGTTATSVDIAFAQFEFGTAPSEYIATTTSAVTTGITDNIPRLDYTDSSCPSLKLEPQRTNLVTQSEYFEASSWSEYVYGGGSLTQTFGYASPQNNNNAYKFDVVVGTGGVLLTQNATITASVDHTLSVWMKGEVGGEKVQIDLKNTASSGVNGQLFTLTTEWVRYDVTITNDASTNRGFQFRMTTSQGISNQTIYVYGAQLEEGSYATSYIPTYGSAVTAAKDIVSNAGNSNTFNDSEGVLFVEFSALSENRDNEFRFLISDGTNNERIQIGLQTNNNLYASIISGNITQASFSYTLSNPTQTHKIAIKYKSNDFSFYVDGTKIDFDTSGATPSGLDRYDFYRVANNNNYVEANVEQTLYFPTALTDEELAALTTL